MSGEGWSAGRRARTGLFALAVLLGGLLAVASVLSWFSTGRGMHVLVGAQAGEYIARLRVLSTDGDTSVADLEAVYQTYRHTGLHWVGLVRDGEVVAEAGERSPEPLDLTPRDRPVFVQGGHRVITPEVPDVLTSDLRERPHVPLARSDDLSFLPTGTRLAFEFRPHLAADIGWSGSRMVMLGVPASVALVALAWLMLGMANRAEATQQELLEQRRLAALGQMSAVLAHEIRNPLAALKGHAQLVEEALTDHPMHGSAARVVGSAQRLEALIEDLLAFARTGEVRLETASPADLVRELQETLGGFEVSTEGAPAAWRFDPAQLRVVLRNLVSNALDAAPGHPVQVVVRGDAGDLVVDVLDGGPGVGDTADRIFEPFFTTKTRGVGLGLAVARRVVERHGGTLTAQDRETGGARFTVRLPRPTEER